MVISPPSVPISSYRGRLAPSATGLLHLGHARTFWTAWQRSAHGTLVLRNEDLDPQRSRLHFAQAMVEDLRWLGVDWREGPDKGGCYGPYAQSERHALYRTAWERLRAGGWLYPCDCSRKDLARLSAAPHEDGAHERDDEPVYPGTCRLVGMKQGVNAADANWRFRVPAGETIEFVDGNLGCRRYEAGRDFGDFLVWRRGALPAYQLAVVVDDAAMRMTEVVRGADLLKVDCPADPPEPGAGVSKSCVVPL